MIKRDILNLVNKTISTFPVTLLTGPRQVGKSTLLRFLLNNKDFTYLSLDDLRLLNEAKIDPALFLDKYKYPLIIDEAQLVPFLFNEINTIVNKVKMTQGNKQANRMYILSGSNKGELLLKTKESLAGRMAYLEMLPLSINELFNRNSIPFNLEIKSLIERSSQIKLNENELFNYIFKGFMPGLYDNKDVDESTFYSSYLQSYIQKDLKQIIHVKDEIAFNNFLMLLASNISQEFIYSEYSKKIGVAVNTIKLWTEALIKTGIIYFLQPYYERSISKRIIKRPKMYFFDTGLAAYLLNMTDSKSLLASPFKGPFFECFVLNELKKSFINNGVNNPIYYFRDTNQNEIDFVYVQNGKLIKIDAKCGEKFTLSDSCRFERLKSANYADGSKAIICTGKSINSLPDGTLIIPFSAI